MTDLDERLIRAIKQADVDTREPRAFGELDDDEEPRASDGAAPEEGIAPPVRHGGPQTGPKGVMADYRYHKKAERDNKDAQRATFLSKLDQQAMSSSKPQARDDDDLDTLFDKDEGLNEVLAQYRDMRLKEMSQSQAEVAVKRPTFGVFREISVHSFLKEIDDENPATPVIIHLYESNVPECGRLNRHLTQLAQKYGYAKFLRLSAAAADEKLDPLALPTLQVYKAGELVCNLVRVTDDMEELGGEHYDVADCEQVLCSHGALKEEYQLEIAAPAPRAIRGPEKSATTDGDGDIDD